MIGKIILRVCQQSRTDFLFEKSNLKLGLKILTHKAVGRGGATESQVRGILQIFHIRLAVLRLFRFA